MQITEVRIKLMDEPGERLKAFCSITFDDAFVVRDLKIIEGANGPFVAMPSRKLTAHCPNCRCKNHLRAAFCNQCGTRLRESVALRDEDGRAKLYADIAHPINSACREMIQEKVIAAFAEEKDRARQPGYVSSYDDFGEDSLAVADAPRPADTVEPRQVQQAEPPRGPHRTPVPSSHTPHTPHTPHSQRASERAKGDFGAGIFE